MRKENPIESQAIIGKSMARIDTRNNVAKIDLQNSVIKTGHAEPCK